MTAIPTNLAIYPTLTQRRFFCAPEHKNGLHGAQTGQNGTPEHKNGPCGARGNQMGLRGKSYLVK